MRSATIKTLAGLFIVCGIAASWVGSTQLSESTFSASFNAPFFSVWLSTTWFVALFPLFALWRRMRAGASFATTLHESSQALFCHLAQNKSRHVPVGLRWAAGARPSYSVTQLARLAVPFLALWMAANYCYVKALMYVSATDVTAVFSIAPVLVAVLSVCVLREPMTVLRGLAVVYTVAGVVLVALADDPSRHGHHGNHSNATHLDNDGENFLELPATSEKGSTSTTTGLMLTVCSGFAAAVYKVSLKVVVGDAPASAIFLLLSTIGTLNVLFLWPVWLSLKEAGVEKFSWSQLPAANLCGSGILGLMFNFLINFGIAYTFPLFISLGTVLGIPVNAIFDKFARHLSFSGMKIGGCVLVVSGFLLLVVERRRPTGDESGTTSGINPDVVAGADNENNRGHLQPLLKSRAPAEF